MNETIKQNRKFINQQISRCPLGPALQYNTIQYNTICNIITIDIHVHGQSGILSCVVVTKSSFEGNVLGFKVNYCNKTVYM